MKRSSFFLLVALAVPTGGALAQEQEANPAPERVIKFFDMRFSDPTSWDCRRPEQNEGFPISETDFTCLTCDNLAAESGDVVVSRAPDGAEETVPVPDGAQVRICADVLTVGGRAEATPSSTPTPGESPTPTPEQTPQS